MSRSLSRVRCRGNRQDLVEITGSLKVVAGAHPALQAFSLSVKAEQIEILYGSSPAESRFGLLLLSVHAIRFLVWL